MLAFEVVDDFEETVFRLPVHRMRHLAALGLHKRVVASTYDVRVAPALGKVEVDYFLSSSGPTDFGVGELFGLQRLAVNESGSVGRHRSRGNILRLRRRRRDRVLLERPRTSVLDVLGALDALGRYWSVLSAMQCNLIIDFEENKF